VKAKRGRPPVAASEKKAVMFCIRLSGDERAKINRAAKQAGSKASDWARAVLVGYADFIEQEQNEGQSG